MPNYRYSQYFPMLFLLADLVCLNLGIYATYLYRFNSIQLSESHLTLQIFLNIIWTLVFFGFKLQKINRTSRLLHHLNKILTGLVINLSIVFAFWFIIQPMDYSRKFLFVTYLVFTLAILFWRSVWHYTIRYYRIKGFNHRNVVIIGKGELSDNLIAYLNETPELGYKIVGILNDQDGDDKIENLETFAIENNTDVIFCCIPNLAAERIKDIIDFAENNLMKVNLISQFSKLVSYNLTIQQFGNTPIININTIPLDSMLNRFVKRTFDIVFSSIVFVLILSWLFPIVVILIKIESKGSAFFKQNRHGRDNKLFKIYKFRTMFLHDDNEVIQAKKGDSRITKIGEILRKSSIDELPQFINVLRGEMSVVGPRPHAVKHNITYQPKIDRFWQRHAVKPGITGLAQTKGFRGETMELSDMSGRVKLDRFYVKNWSLILDFKIILLTVLTILKGDQNAY